MKMTLNIKGTNVELDEYDQSIVYEFYRIHSTMDRLLDVIDEQELDIKFKNDQCHEDVAKRVLSIMDDYHVFEDDAIEQVFSDKDFMKAYTK